jgi:hypothetical protein
MYDQVGYYNPAIGRFTSEDPIGFEGGNNLFTFVMGNPINGVDQFGLVNQSMVPINLQDMGNYKFIGTAGLEFILDSIKGVWASSIGYNWCCFANCIGENKELLDIFSQQMLYNIMIAATAKYNPEFYFILINEPLWEWTELVFNLTSVYGVIDEVGTCYKKCLKH